MKEFELLTIAAVQSRVVPLVARLLEPNQFVETQPLKWVDSTRAPIRRIFSYTQLKGGVMGPRWGYSFDFVPHLAAGKMKWHRTEKSADFDAWVDGQSVETNICYMYGEAGLLEGMDSRLEAAVQKAQDFWRTGEQDSAIYDQVVALSERPRAAIHVQLPIAAAFCHAQVGREEEARRAMAGFIERNEPRDDEIPKLWAALEGVLKAVPNRSAVA